MALLAVSLLIFSSLLHRCIFSIALNISSSMHLDFHASIDCDYYSSGIYSISPKHKMSNSIVIDNRILKVEFDIKLNNYCQTLCNILHIRNHDFESISLSVNFQENVFEISVIHNYIYYYTIKFSNASIMLPTDNKYHHIFLLFLHESSEISLHANIFKIDEFTHYYHATPFLSLWNSSIHKTYQIYFSNINAIGVTAQIKHICIKTSFYDGIVQCGQTITGNLVSKMDIIYYYFNIKSTTGASKVIFTCSNSSIQINIDLYKPNAIHLYDEYTDMLRYPSTYVSGKQFTVPALYDGEYVLKMFGITNPYAQLYRDMAHWEISVTCLVQKQNMTNYRVIVNDFGWNEWWDAERACENMFYSTLATIITEQDMHQAIELINFYIQTQNITTWHAAWIGLYRFPVINSQWNWVDGTSCAYTVSGDCIDQMFWHTGQPSTILYGNDTAQYRDPRGAYLSVSNEFNMQNMYENTHHRFDYLWNGFHIALCNAPNGKYQIHNCSQSIQCWLSINCCDDTDLNSDVYTKVYNDNDPYHETNQLMKDVVPSMVYWNSTLFIVGANEIHYTYFDLFHIEYNWKHISLYDAISCIRAPEQLYAQIRSTLYMLCNHYHANRTIKTYTLIDVNLNNLNTKSYAVPQTALNGGSCAAFYYPNTPYCMVAGAYYVYIFMDPIILIFDRLTHDWSTSTATLTPKTVPDACVISNELDFIYLFNWYDQVTYKYNTFSRNYITLITPNFCTADIFFVATNRITGIAGKNGNIYLQGCGFAPWKTIVFNTKIDQFELKTVSIDEPKSINLKYYRESQMTVFEDNVLLLLYRTNFSRLNVHYTVTDLVSINFEKTNASNIWPSNGFTINYYINDFTYTLPFNVNVLFYTNHTTNTINVSTIFNPLNDNCICDKIYQCLDCDQEFKLSNYVSTADNHIDEIEFYVRFLQSTITTNLNPLITPSKLTVSLQRCNIFIQINDTYTTYDASILHFSYSLSPNCYWRNKRRNYSLSIISKSTNISKQLMISISILDEVSCNICDTQYRYNCYICSNNRFIVEHNTVGLVDMTFKVLFESNMIDFRINYGNNAFRYVTGSHKYFKQPWYLLFLLIIPCVIIVAITIYCRIQYMNAFIVDKSLVFIIAVCQFDDKTLFLDGVKQNVRQLLDLWQDSYNYDVFVCNKDTLYCTKQDIIDFIDNHKCKLKNKEYKSVIVHIITHGSQNTFKTSDMKSIDIAFVTHELITESEYEDHSELIKLIFCHTCRGTEDYSSPTNTKYSAITRGGFDIYNAINNRNVQNMAPDSNCIVVYGNIQDRTMSDDGNFTMCLCNVFKANLKKMIKADFHTLIVSIGRNLEKETNNAELCNVSSSIRYNNIRFEKSNDIEKLSAIQIGKKNKRRRRWDTEVEMETNILAYHTVPEI
eukprot:259806_1